MTEFYDDQYWGHVPHVPMYHQGHRHNHIPILSNVGDDEEHDAIVFSTMGEGPKGEKGDPTYFDDLTEDQLQEIYRAASFVGNKTEDAIVTTTGDSTTVITLPFDYDEFDMLFVDVNGLDLAEGDDYSIVGNTVSLVTPLPAGQEVHFRALKYQLVDGDKTIQITDDRKDYNTVAEMQADDTLKPGDICHTLGFHAAGDGGGAWYKVVSHAVANGMDVILLNNDLLAELINTNNAYENVACHGAGNTTPTANSNIIEYVIEKNRGGKVYFPKGNYSIATPISTYQGKDNFTDLIFDENAIVSAAVEIQYLLHIGGIPETLEFEAGYKKYLTGGIFNATSNVTTAVIIVENPVKDIDISNCVILANASNDNYDMAGIILGTDSTVSQDAYLHNITIENKATVNITGKGLVINSNDNSVRDCRLYYFLVNTHILGSSQFLSDIHTLAYPNVNSDISIKVDSDCVFLSNYYADSESIFLDIAKTGSYVNLDNCQYYSYQNKKLTFARISTWARLLFNNVVYFAARGESGVKNVGIEVLPTYIARTIAESNFNNVKIEAADNVEDGDLLKNNSKVIFSSTNLLASNANWLYLGTYNVIPDTWNNIVVTVANRTIQIPIWNTLTSQNTMYTDIGGAVAIGGRDNNATYTIGFVFSSSKKRVSVYMSCTHTRLMQEIKLIGSSGGISNEYMRYHELTSVSQEPTFDKKFQIVGSSGAITQV